MDKSEPETAIKPELVSDIAQPPTKPEKAPEHKITLSKFTDALIHAIESIKPKANPDDQNKLNVSRTVSFFAFAYEKVRNAIEYRDEHLFLRAATERILKRRLSMNPEGTGEAENLLRELVWARYFPNGKLGDRDIDDVQTIIDDYLLLRRYMLTGRNGQTKQYLAEFLFELMTCEIEEYLNPAEAEKESTYTFFIYQILRNKIRIEDVSEQQKDSIFLVALDKAFRKSDRPYQRYHLFTTFYKPVHEYTEAELVDLSAKLVEVFHKIDAVITNPTVDRLMRYVRKQLPPFLILFNIINKKLSTIRPILATEESLWSEVDYTCRQIYSESQSRLRNLAIKSLIYIFATKMVLALILEYPISLYLFKEVSYLSIVINSLVPPLLMLLIVMFVKIPGDENTKRIFSRLIDIVNKDETFETAISYRAKKPRPRRPVLTFGFTVFYSLTFIVTIAIILEFLTLLNFNFVSQFLFIFFVSVVTFFSFRIVQVANEYKLEEREGIFAPFVDFFVMPILSIGKFFSSEIGKLNFFIFIFDFLIEAPFKLIFEVVEEWIKFTKQRKEEII